MTEEVQVDGPVSRGRGRRRSVPKAYSVARRLPLRFTADHPAPDALVSSSLFATPWDLPAPAGRRRVPAKRKFKAYPVGYFHLDIAESEPQKANSTRLSQIDRASNFAFVELHEKVTRRTASDFLRRLIAVVPYKVHTVLADNRTYFTASGSTSSAAPDIKAALNAGEPVWAHAFEYACAQNGTSGQVERMNRTVKDATVKRDFYETHERLRTHMRDFVDAYNFARRHKTLRGLTPRDSSAKPGLPTPLFHNQSAPPTAGTKHLGGLGRRGRRFVVLGFIRGKRACAYEHLAFRLRHAEEIGKQLEAGGVRHRLELRGHVRYISRDIESLTRRSKSRILLPP